MKLSTDDFVKLNEHNVFSHNVTDPIKVSGTDNATTWSEGEIQNHLNWFNYEEDLRRTGTGSGRESHYDWINPLRSGEAVNENGNDDLLKFRALKPNDEGYLEVHWDLDYANLSAKEKAAQEANKAAQEAKAAAEAKKVSETKIESLDVATLTETQTEITVLKDVSVTDKVEANVSDLDVVSEMMEPKQQTLEILTNTTSERVNGFGETTQEAGDFAETAEEAGQAFTNETSSNPLAIVLGSSFGAVALFVIIGLWVWCRRKRNKVPVHVDRRRLVSKTPQTLTQMLDSMNLELVESVSPEMENATNTCTISSEANQDQSLTTVFGLVFGITIFIIAAVAYCTRRFQTKSSVTSKYQAPRVIIAQ